MNTDTVIRKVQELVNITVDGRAGPETWQAVYEGLSGNSLPKTAAFVGKVDARSEATIATLRPQVAPYARSLVQRAATAGIVIKIIGGTRTYAEQDALFAQGRTRPGKRVTNAKGGESNHNFGIAFDIGVFDGTNYLGDSPSYGVVGPLGMDIGLEWAARGPPLSTNHTSSCDRSGQTICPRAKCWPSSETASRRVGMCMPSHIDKNRL